MRSISITIFLVLVTGLFRCVCASSDQLHALLEKYESIAASDADREDKVDLLLRIEVLSRTKGLPQEAFFANLELAKLYTGRDMVSFDGRIAKLDSLIDGEGRQIADTSLVSYFLTKGYGRLLTGYRAEALENFLFAYHLAEEIGRGDLKMDAKSYLGSYYTMVGENEKALEMEKSVLRYVAKSIPFDSLKYADHLSNVGIVFSRLLQNDSAVIYLKKALSYNLFPPGELPTRYYYLGESYINIGVYDSAAQYLHKAIDLESAVPQSNFLNTIFLQMGKLYKAQLNYDSSAYYFNQAIVALDTLKRFNSLRYAYGNLLALRLRTRGDTVSLGHFVDFQLAIDSMNRRSSRDLEQRYQVEFRTLEKEAKIRELELERREEANLRLWMALLFGGISMVGLFLLFRSRTKRKLLRQKLALEAVQKAKMQSDLEGKQKELAAKIDQVNRSRSMIADLEGQLSEQYSTQEIVATLERNYITDQEWDAIIIQFQSIHGDFFASLKSQSDKLTQNDLKLSILMRLGYSSAAIAEIMKISKDGVRKARQRLKEKVGDGFMRQISA